MAISSASTWSGVLPLARPRRWETRKTWVSTAMAGSMRSSFKHHRGGLAPDAGQGLQRLAGQRDLAAVLLDQDAGRAMTFFAFML